MEMNVEKDIVKNDNLYIYDIETFLNCFSLVAERVYDNKVFEFVLFEDDQLNNAEDLFQFLWTNPMLVGYNNVNFDGQIIEEIWKKKLINGRDIYEFTQQVIDTKDSFQLPYKQWTFSRRELDLMAINNYGIYGTATSLKWLEFTTRRQSIQDMPKKHYEELTLEDIPDLLKYNRHDVKNTRDFYDLCTNKIDMRTTLSKKYNDDIIMNQPDSSIGAKIVLNSYCDYTGKDKRKVKKSYTKRKEIVVKDIILPYIKFDSKLFKDVKKDFESLILKSDSKGVIKLKKVYEKEIEFQNMKVKYALGGIHGCVESGIYSSSKTHVIKTYDVTSMYPNLAIANEFFPEHLGVEFCHVYKNILNERKKYDKKTEPEMNLAYKTAANSVYGKSNATHDGFLKDPRYTVQTTINGQLVLSMLGERLSEIGEFIMWNTDGSEILIRRDKEDEYNKICEEWCALTGIDLEHDEYETMWVKDVNNYMAKSTSGKVKRKGMFMVYDDYKGSWNKNPSGLIIPEAIQAYFLNGVKPETTIKEWDNIHDFLFGLKGTQSFSYLVFDIHDNVIHGIDENSDRAVRYYCAKNGGSIMKWWKKGKKSLGVPFESAPGTKGQSIKLLQHIQDRGAKVYRDVRNVIEPTEYEVLESGKRKVVKKSIVEMERKLKYPDLDYDYYINKTWEWINLIEGSLISKDDYLTIVKQAQEKIDDDSLYAIAKKALPKEEQMEEVISKNPKDLEWLDEINNMTFPKNE